MDLREAAVRSLMHLSGAWLRNRWMRFGKMTVWNRLCIPHLSWRSDEITCRTVQGHRFRVRPNDFVENRICFFGEWEPAITAVFESQLHHGDVAVDVGANIGFYSVLAAKLIGDAGRVYSLEPSPSIRARLQANLELNHIRNVETLPYAAWHESGHATLKLMDGNRGGSSLGATEHSTSSETVEMRRLDELIPPDVWPRVRVLKIDVEGAEWSALLGAEKILKAAPSMTVICEVSPDRLASLDANAEQVMRFMSDLGYAGYRMDNDYSAAAYIKRDCLPPTKLTAAPATNCDIMFTRNGA